MQQTAIAIDLGGTKCAGALINDLGEILDSDKKLLESRSGQEVSDLIGELCLSLAEKGRNNNWHVRGIGISVPGISYRTTGQVWAPNIPGWTDFPLKNKIEEVFPEGTRVMIDNDRACCILGETWLGAARGSQNAIFLTVGTGIGAGILVDGKILRGADDIAGAIGWLALESEYLEKYEKYGCFEYHASGNGLVREAEDLLRTETYDNHSKLNLNNLSTTAILEAYTQQDTVAEMVIRKAVGLWGKASANLISLFKPEIIVFGGGLFGPARILIDSIHSEAARWAQPISMKKVKIVNSILGNNAPLLGAAKLIVDQYATI
jgi:glucokinase